MKMKLSDYVIEFIVRQGVRHVFFLPGGAAMHLNDSLGKCRSIQYVNNLHEQASALAAEAYARVSGGLGVAMVTAGPGATNALTGVNAAWVDSTPCLFLSGQVKRPDLIGDSGLRQRGLQEIDIVSMVRCITKYAVTILDPVSVRYHMEKACHLAMTGRKGPVWLDFPLDVQAATVDVQEMAGYDPSESTAPESPEALDQSVRQAIHAFNHAERPVILAGNGIRSAGAEHDFSDLYERLQVPVLTTRLGVDLIPGDHPLCFGMPGAVASRGANFILQNSDWLMILGARMDMGLIAYAPERLARGAHKIMVNIDPAEIRKLGVVIDNPVAADAGAFIRRLLNHAHAIKPVQRTRWMDRCRQWRAEYPFELPKELARQAPEISLYRFSKALSDAAAASDLILPGSSGFCAEIFLTGFKAKAGQRIVHNKGTGAMGLGQPAAIGACLAGGRRRTICVDGDGGFQLNVQELETVRRLNLPIKFFVINNQGYASIRSSQQGYFKRLAGADASSGLTLPDIVKVASAYGLAATRLCCEATLGPDLREVLDTPGPVVCDVMVIPDEPRAPRVSSMQRPDGSMVSMPLEDMWPFLDREEFHRNMIVPPLDISQD